MKMARTWTVALVAVSGLAVSVPPGATGEALSCDDGQRGGVHIRRAPTVEPGAPTPMEAAEIAREILDPLPVEPFHTEQIAPDLVRGEAEDVEAHIHIDDLTAGGYAIESIDYCYSGPPLEPMIIE